ncbi:DgyrCDS12685 [Dimorphilus gyrociliatus]|uniref:DgyrCDS12685 n=1 Tax=Dimorphilus gyrociliatus TaxID=2664684 RepID=A0A7I8W831_9ANNE|nr:DgyrCDS12685 [Dimorphilus gyrociliatus]
MTAPISNEYINITADKSSSTNSRNEKLRMRKTVKINSESSFDSKKSLESQEEEEKPKRSLLQIFLILFACVCAGFVFGWCLEKSRVFEPNSIRQQMIFKRWIMLKVFLTAVAVGQIVLIVLSLLPWTKDKFSTALKAYYCGFQNKSILTSAIGAFVLGSGMTICGACPGMVLSQVGTWTGNAYMTLLGALTGALIYGLFAPWIVKFTKPKKPLEHHLIHEQFNINYIALALPMAILLGVAVGLMEHFIPWREDYSSETTEGKNIFQYKIWPPYVCGILIGLLQAILVLFVNDTMGGSSSYVTIVSQWVVTENLQKKFPYLASARLGVANWWQVLYVCSAIIGALSSAAASDTLSSTPGVHKAAAYFGGFIMLIGARFASGCTSGHGLSGMGVLAWLSFVAVPFMFGGGIATAFIFKKCDILIPTELN